jgi:hypothetical protein
LPALPDGRPPGNQPAAVDSLLLRQMLLALFAGIGRLFALRFLGRR